MTRRDFLIKWAVYGVALLPVWFLEQFVLNRFPILGAVPMLLPLAAIATAVLEGSAAGAGYGLAVGVLWDACALHSGGVIILGLTVLSMAAGIAAQYVLSQGFAGCLICSAATLVIIDAARVLVGLARGEEALALLRMAGVEIVWSLVFVFPIFLLYRWIHSRTEVSTLF